MMAEKSASDKEKFEYYESHLYNPVIAQAVLQYDKSSKNSADEESVLETLEFITLKKFHAQSCLDVISSEQSSPSTIKISDLLSCIDSILQRKYLEVEECLKSLNLLDEKTHEATLRMNDVYFERVTSCMIKLTQSYKDWSSCGIPVRILNYLAFFSKSLRLSLLFHQMLRNLLNHLTPTNTEDATSSNWIFACFRSYSAFSAPARNLIEKSKLSGPDLIQMIDKLKNEKNLKDFIQKVLSLSEIQCSEQRQRILDNLDQASSDTPVFFVHLDGMLEKFKDSTNTERNEMIELAGVYHLVRLIRDDSMCAEAIVSLLYTQRLISGYYEFYIVSRQQNIAAIKQVPFWGVQEVKKALEFFQDPAGISTESFIYIIDGLSSLSTINCIYSKILLGQSEDDLIGMNKAAQPLFDAWFSEDSGLIHLLLNKLRGSRKTLILNNDLYFDAIFALLKICDDLQAQRTATLQAGGGFLISKYHYVNADILKLIDEEAFDALNSDLGSNLLLLWSKLVFYGFKWRMVSQDIPGFCNFAIMAAENIINDQLLRLKEHLAASDLTDKTSRADIKLLGCHSLTVTGILLVICSNEMIGPEQKDQFLKNLKIDEVLKYFSELKAWLDQQGNELLFKIACYYYGFYFGICSNIQGAKLQTDNDDLLFSLPQFEQFLKLATEFSHPNLRFIDLLYQMPIQITKVGIMRPDYLRSLHSSGFVQFMCKEVLFNLETVDLIRLETQTDLENHQEIKFEQLKIYLYDQMVEDQNFDQVSKIIMIYMEQLMLNSKTLQENLLKFQEIHKVEKHRCVSYFWRICLDLKTFLRALEDLLEQINSKSLAEARTLIKNLEQALVFAVKLLLSLPFTSQDSQLTELLIRTLNHVSFECQRQCLMLIRSSLTSHLSSEKSSYIVEKYKLDTQRTGLADQSKGFKFHECLMPLMLHKLTAEFFSFYFDAESLFSLFEPLDFGQAQKLRHKISEKSSFTDDCQFLTRIWISFMNEVVGFSSVSCKALREMLHKISQLYFKFFSFCYDNNEKRILPFLFENLIDQIQNCKSLTHTSGLSELIEGWGSLFVSTGLSTNYILYCLKCSDRPSNKVAEMLRDLLSRKEELAL